MIGQDGNYKHLLLFIITVLTVGLVTLTGCITINPPPAASPAPAPTPTPAYLPAPEALPPNPTHTQLFLRVVERLTHLAQTSEAKEYVSIWLTEPSTRVEFFAEGEVWNVGISNGPEGYELIRRADWFKVANEGYFFDTHWDEPRPVWIVYQDGRIIPMGKGLMIEADIYQLNTSRTLE